MRNSFATSRRPAYKAPLCASPLAWLLDPEQSVSRKGERRQDIDVWRIDPTRGDRRRSGVLFN
jgi:hypothetical protein